ncbi:TPA: hypothetical protein QH850_001315 [Enterobacter chengduensis]|nr:hypothetical protein [Enterobacter chengduensis]
MEYGLNSKQPVSLSELKYRLLELKHNSDIPFSVVEQKDKLIASWKIVDAKWIEFFGIGGLKKQYELTLLFNEAKNRVSYREKSIDIETELSTDRVGFKKQVQWGSRKEFSFGKSWGIKTDGVIGEQYSYKFSTSDIKSPVFSVINNSGWELKKSSVDKFGFPFIWIVFFALVLLVVRHCLD